MYWLILTTPFWLHAFGQYATLEDCQRAREQAPWYASANCLPAPKPMEDSHR